MKNIQHEATALTVHFISHAPKCHRRSVPVALYHVTQIRLPVLIKKAAIGAVSPFVGEFLQDIEAHLVTQLHQQFIRDVVRGTDRIAAHILKQFQSPVPGF